MNRSSHIVISGTGRSGTSFLMHLFTELCMDTGFAPGSIEMHPDSRAGLEHDMRLGGKLPYIVKDPHFCNYAQWAFENFNIDKVIIPVRNLEDAATSRRKIWALNQSIDPVRPTHGGGLFNSGEPVLQEAALAIAQHRLIEACVKNNVPMVFLHYPSFLNDSKELYETLNDKGVLSSRIISWPIFNSVFGKIINREWVK